MGSPSHQRPEVIWQSFCFFWYSRSGSSDGFITGTSSSWLKAIPHACLGLAIPGPEFIIGLRIWLGVSLFPLSPLCTCLSTIDNFGDHLLGCSQGPMRIRRHNALVNVIYNALSQDHPGVLKEQRASHDHGSCPGDVFHPDFQDGRSAFFDISVCSTTQPTFISSSDSWAGVAAVAVEVAKDEKHSAAVEKVGHHLLWRCYILLQIALLHGVVSLVNLLGKICCNNWLFSYGWVILRWFCITGPSGLGWWWQFPFPLIM